MVKQLLLSTLLLATAWGSVIGERTTKACKPKTEGFDLPNSLLGQTLPLLFGQVGDGTYGDLQYSGASKINAEDVLVPGVFPKSRPNTAAIGLLGTATDYLLDRLFGTRVGSTTLSPSTTITPVKGNVASFDLRSVWIGCGTGAASEFASQALPCTVTVTGTDVRGKAKSTETITFGPDQGYNATLGFKEFVGWEEMVKVTMAVVDSGLPSSVTVLFFDDWVYCPHYL